MCSLHVSPRDPPSANSITMQKYLPITNIAISYCGHRYWLSRTSVENTLIRGGVVTNIAISYCGHRYWLLRTSVENTLIRGGVVTNIAISYCGHRYWLLRTSQCKST
jgi:predicted Rdx family selenoprotein